MILKASLLLVLSVAWAASGASYSNVYFQTGPETAPAATLEYVPSASYNGPQLAQLNAASVGYNYPWGYNYGIQCSAGSCFYPGQSVPTVASVAPSANVIALNTPAPNVVYTTGQEPVGYQFSYSVYDQRSGEQNVESQSNEGEAVRGEYVIIQPGGNVEYVAENEKGLDALIKSIVPEVKHTHHAAPCHDAKSGTLTIHESHHKHEAAEGHEEHHAGHHEVHEHQDLRHSSHEELQVQAKHHEISEEKEDKESHEEHEDHESNESHEDLKEDENNEIELVKNIEIIIVDKETPSEHENLEHSSGHHHTHEKLIEGSHKNHEEESAKNVEVIFVEHEKPMHENENLEASEHHHAHAKLIEGPHIETITLHEHENVDHHALHHESHQASTHEHSVVDHNAMQLVSYNDVIKCIQNAMSKANNHPLAKPPSALTYLILNKPC